MIVEPAVKRCVIFFDGQNLFHAAQEAFGYISPNFDPIKLASAVCQPRGWTVQQIRFYTGVHVVARNAFWHTYWSNKLAVMGAHGIKTIPRPLRYRNRTVDLPGGKTFTFPTAEEKGIDVRIAVDLIRMAHRNEYDVGLVFSQDQDLAEVAEEIRVIAREQARWIRLASAFPASTTYANARGINKTDWIPIDKTLYDACLDPRDYRPKVGGGQP
jgi:uncharacterized LabA/DUF88 family protein